MKFRPALQFEGPVRSLVPADVAPDLLAVLGEALSNASRHAEATRVQVLLAASDEITLTITDDGRGLPDHVVEGGLGNMRERAHKHGGETHRHLHPQPRDDDHVDRPACRRSGVGSVWDDGPGKW